MNEGMDEATKADLEADKLTSWFHSYGITGPWSCLQCRTGIRKARYLKAQDGRRYVTLTFCSQECHDLFFGKFKGSPVRWEKFNEDGILIGFVVPKRGFVSIEEIENAQNSGGNE